MKPMRSPIKQDITVKGLEGVIDKPKEIYRDGATFLNINKNQHFFSKGYVKVNHWHQEKETITIYAEPL